MKRFYSRLGIAVAALALVSAPAVAGQRPHDSGSTPASDRAVERGSGSSSSAGSGPTSSGGSAVSGGSVGSTSTAPSAGASSPTFGGADRHAPMYAEPQRRGGGNSGNSGGSSANSGSRRGGDSSGGGERAVPRGSSGSGSSGTSKSGNDATTSSSSAGNRREAPARENGEVPSWSRPRGDRPATGTATQRTGPPPDRNHSGGYYGRYYDPFYSYYGYGLYGSYYYPGFGLGYGYGMPLFYDPWYDPYGGYGGGHGYAGGGGGYYSGTQYASVDQGKVRLKVKPRNAKVYVDGYFVGDVDQFDGMFQKLSLNGGRHHVEIKADGYETAEFDVMIMPEQTVTYEGELKRIQ